MKKSTIFLLFMAGVLIGLGIHYFPFSAPPKTGPKGETSPTQQPATSSESVTTKTMKITSPAFSQDGPIAKKYSCDGSDINPPLEFKDVPEEAKSLALIFDDPDAPGQTFVHWTVWNIDPDTQDIEEDSVPAEAIQGKTGFGKSSYGGPCPPSGEHRYFFKLYALDKKLDLSSNAGKQDLLQAMEGHKLAEAQLMGVYERE